MSASANLQKTGVFLDHARSKGCAAADFWVWDYVAQKKNADLLDAIAKFSWAANGGA